jgi:hypothetical protein
MFQCLVIQISLATTTLYSRPGSLWLLSYDSHVRSRVWRKCRFLEHCNSGTKRRHKGALPLVGESELKRESELKLLARKICIGFTPKIGKVVCRRELLIFAKH